jgi:hypothetical protein
MAAPAEVEQLVERFRRNLDAYKRDEYKESRVRVEFIDPFFEALGWDVRNVHGYAEQYKDVVHEAALKVGGEARAPDYCFRIGGVRKFFLEAKKPSVSVKGDVAPAYQLRRYAWSATLPLSVLTDFEEFAVYDCRQRPKPQDNASVGRVMYLTFDEYLDKWDDIAGIFAKESVLTGSFDQYVQEAKRKRGTGEVDAEFLKEIEGWREVLARNIALRNPGISVHELNFAVQRTIDRVIFLRISEDRGIEDYGRLLALTNGPHIYKRMHDLYRQADEKYNAGLFDFQADTLTKSLTIDDKVLKPVLTSLYYPQSPYEFSVLPADILGQVYEQFLGKVIRLTPGHRAKVEEKPEVKKAGGVYYTPTYIVDYIVKQTVGKLVEGKTPRQISKLRILDPACGSGSFLLGAYQYLLDHHRQWYEANDPAKHAKKKKPAVYQGQNGNWRLTTSEKKRILLNNLYGVDIDRQAVEVTKLSLLLKVLEGESEETLGQQLMMWRERALPDLGDNIKCGNSLIGPDYYDGQLIPDEEEMRRVNPFDWQAEFPEIMTAGGFDAVIGNPPYVDVKLLGDDIKQILSQHFSSATRRFDLYVPFVEQGLKLLRNKGLLGYIIPSMFVRRPYGRDLRSTIIQLGTIGEIVDFGSNQVFIKAMNYVGVFIIEKSSKQKDVPVTRCNRAGLDQADLKKCLAGEDVQGVKRLFSPANAFSTPDEWYLFSKAEAELIQRAFRSYPELDSILSHASEGIHSGKDQVFFVPRETVKSLGLETPPAYPLAKGKDVHRYQTVTNDDLKHFVIYPYDLLTGNVYDESTMRSMSPSVWNYLKESRGLLKGRAYFDRSNKHWFELWCPRKPHLYTSPKIVGPEIAIQGEFTLNREQLFVNNKLKVLIPREGVDEQIEYLLGLLNSSLLVYLHRSIAPPKGGGFFEVKTGVMNKLPIRTIDFDDPKDVARHDKMVALVERMLDLHKKLAAAEIPDDKELYQRQIEATDRHIDALVYELYELTEEEIEVVEGEG